MLSTEVKGSAYWSRLELPIPYLCPFGTPSVSALFHWLTLTMVQTHLHLRYSWILARRDVSLGYCFTPI